jgi:hypothetical protein
MLDRQKLRQAFEEPAEFTTSPLYRTLSRTVAAHDELLDLAARGRPGQCPTFLFFFGAVHRLLLRGAELAETISTRLVQTNHVQRALGLRLGLSMIARDVAAPVHLIEVGASAGARGWLEALIWPENHGQRALLRAALELAAAEPPLIHAGDAIDVLPGAVTETVAVVDGHLRWIETLPAQARRLTGSQAEPPG